MANLWPDPKQVLGKQAVKPSNTASTLWPTPQSLGVGSNIQPRGPQGPSHEEYQRQQQESFAKADEAQKKEQNPGVFGQVKNFVSSFSPNNIASTVKNAAQDVKKDPAGAAFAIPLGLLDTGSKILNNVNSVQDRVKNLIKSPFGIAPKYSPKFPVFSEQLQKARDEFNPGHAETDTTQALRTSATNVAGYELGGAALKGLGATSKIISGVAGNVLGGQLTAEADSSLKDRAKQAAFDAAFGLVTEGTSKLLGSAKKSFSSKPITSKIIEESKIGQDQSIIYKPKNLGTDSTGQKVLGKTEFDSKTGRAIIYYDHSLNSNPALKTRTIDHELGHVMDKRMNKGVNLSAELPNYKGNKSNLDVALADFASKQNKPVEQIVNEINRDINKLAQGSNPAEQFANAVAEYKQNPTEIKAKAPIFVALMEHNSSSILEHKVVKSDLISLDAPGTTKFKDLNPLGQAKATAMGYVEEAPRKKYLGTKVIPEQSLEGTSSVKEKIKTVIKTKDSPFSSTGLKTGKTVKTEGYNPKTINAPEDTQALFEKLGQGKNTNRISKSNEDIRDLARMTGLTEEQLKKTKPGSIANAETVTAARQLVLDKAQELMNYLKGVDVSVATPEQLKGIKDRFVRLVSMQKSVAGLRTEASNVFRSLGIELMPGENATLSELGGILKQAGLASGDDAALFAGKAAKEFNLTAKQKLGQGALSTWYASILSGPKTTARNILSTSANILTELASKSSNPKLWKEVPTSVSGLLRGLKQGGREALEVLKGKPSTGKFTETGGLTPSPFDTNFDSPFVNKTIRTYGAIVESVGRFLNAQDTLLKSGAREMENASHKVQGISDERLSKAISDAYAESTVYHGLPRGKVIGALRNTAQTLRSQLPTSKIIVPFVDTVANVLDRQFDYLPITSQLRAGFPELFGMKGSLTRQVEKIAQDYNITSEVDKTLIMQRLKDQQIGRMVLGTVISGAAVTLAANGRVSGVGPTNVNERNQLQESGWRPNSIKIGDTWVPYANLGPLAGIFAMAGNVYDKTHYDKSPTKDITDLLFKGLVGWTQSQLNSSFLSGVADLLDVIGGSVDPKKYGINLITGLVPIPALYSQTKDMIRRQQFETRNIQEKLKLKLGITGDLQPRLSALGRPQKQDLIYGLTPSKSTNDPVLDYLVKNDLVVSKPNLNQQYDIPGTTEKRALTPEEYTRYLKESGDEIYKQLRSSIDAFNTLTPELKEKQRSKIVDTIRERVRKRILLGN